MANVKTPCEMVAKAPVQNNKAPFSSKAKHIYCILCRRPNLKHEAQEHMHSMLHHRELETVLGKGTFHECHACKVSSMGLNEYAQHISTAQHKARLKSLMTKNIKPLSLTKTLSAEVLDRILERNKMLKKEEKKAMRKKKKKLKQVAGQRPTAMPQTTARQNTVMSRVVITKQVNTGILKHVQETHHEGSNNSVVQNKENKASHLQRPPLQRESSLQNQSRSFACWSGEPAGQSLQHPLVRDQFTQSSQQLKYEDNFNGQFRKVKVESSQTDRPIIADITKGDATNMSKQTTWTAVSQHDHYNTWYVSATDFTSDHLPPNGAIIFDHGQNESTGQEGSRHSAQHAVAKGSVNGAPMGDKVSAMLREIRRTLDVKEPGRADRESGKAGALRPTSAAALSHFSQVSSRAPASHSVVQKKCGEDKAKQRSVKVTQAATEDCGKTSQLNNTEFLVSHDSLSQCLDRTTSSEHNLNITRKVRIAHKSCKVQGEREAGLKPTMNKLLSFSETNSRLSWKEMHGEKRQKKQEGLKGIPRFGTEESCTQAEDVPLSEGFHWESLPDSPSGAHWADLPPHTQDTTNDDPHPETQPDSQVQQPDAAQEGCNSQMVRAVTVKSEPTLQDQDEELRDSSSAKKRKPQDLTDDSISDNGPRGKKKKTKSNKDKNQMEQLLAVSLREEELSRSLQDLDSSLVQARTALQAAYTEVQRLLLLRQQCTAEVNSLRAKRIEILQGMQGGYSGASNVTEKSITSLAGAAPTAVQPRLAPLPSSSAFSTSSSQQLPPTNAAASISQPHPGSLPSMPVQQDMCQPLTCRPDTHQLRVNQHLPFSSEMLTSLPISTPHLAAPATTVISVKQPCSKSAIPSPELPARQDPQVVKEEFKDSVKTARFTREEVDHDSGEDTSGNLGQATEKPVSTFVPERARNASAAVPPDDGGNESDDSIKVMPSNLVVIDIDESDNEETTSNVPVPQNPPQKPVSVKFSSAGSQMLRQKDETRKVQTLPVPEKDATVPPDCVEDEEPYLGAFENHNGPVYGLQIHEGLLYTCSGDNTARAYSLMTGECRAVFKGHTNNINCLLVSSLPGMAACLYTGSSDQTIRCYSIKSQKFLQQISLPDRVLCLHVAWNILFAGLANGSVVTHDLKTLKHLDVFECHGPRGVSCLGTAQEGARRVLLVGSYDSTISVRDAKSGLLLRSLEGHTKTVLCMKVVNDLVFSGSSDTAVHAHNIHTGELVRIYKGHCHAVTSIVILGKVMVTACLDKLVRVYELQSHDRLQVYGGHSDMVMCMAIHKSVIYTGCYDGSIQAVKLNLMKNYRCWWQNCSLIFGMAEHLVQHLVGDHSNPNLQTVKCRWKGCSKFFAGQQSVRQELPEHMQNHVDKDGKVQP